LRLSVTRQHERAPDHQAGDGDFNVIDLDVFRAWLFLEQLLLEGVTGEGLQADDLILKGLAVVFVMHRCQVQQVSAVAGLVHGQSVVQPVRQHRTQTFEVWFQARWRLRGFAGRAGMRIDPVERRILEKTDLAQSVGLQ